MRDIWLVASGDYSDYHVIAAFETEELADAYISAVATSEHYQEWPSMTPYTERCQLWDAVPHAGALKNVGKLAEEDRR